MPVTYLSEDDLQATIGKLEASLVEAIEERHWLMGQHLEACEKIDQLARIITAILLALDGIVFVPKTDDGGLPSTMGFSVRDFVLGFEIVLQRPDLDR